MADGHWFKTGDVATRTAEGEIRIVGRRSTDVIKTGGYKVGAGEIEEALAEHPAVVEAAVKGEPDDDLGERIVAWVVLAPGATADGPALADHVAAWLAPHKRPRTVHFVAELPRNALGKLLKGELAEPEPAAEAGSRARRSGSARRLQPGARRLPRRRCDRHRRRADRRGQQRLVRRCDPRRQRAHHDRPRLQPPGWGHPARRRRRPRRPRRPRHGRAPRNRARRRDREQTRSSAWARSSSTGRASGPAP